MRDLTRPYTSLVVSWIGFGMRLWLLGISVDVILLWYTKAVEGHHYLLTIIFILKQLLFADLLIYICTSCGRPPKSTQRKTVISEVNLLMVVDA